MLTEIRHLRQSGHTLRGIATALNHKALRTRRGSAWRLEHVARIIKQTLADPRRLAGRFIGTRKTSKNHLVTRKTHLSVKDGDSFCRGGGRMKRELARVLLDEIVRTRAQLVRVTPRL